MNPREIGKLLRWFNENNYENLNDWETESEHEPFSDEEELGHILKYVLSDLLSSESETENNNVSSETQNCGEQNLGGSHWKTNSMHDDNVWENLDGTISNFNFDVVTSTIKIII